MSGCQRAGDAIIEKPVLNRVLPPRSLLLLQQGALVRLRWGAASGGYPHILHNCLTHTLEAHALVIHTTVRRGWPRTKGPRKDLAVTWGPDTRSLRTAGGEVLLSVTGVGFGSRLRDTQTDARSRRANRIHRRYRGGRMPGGTRAGAPGA